MDYIWICGPSAIGKATLIAKLCRNEDELRAEFGLWGTVEARGGCFGSAETKELAGLKADHVLIKWQQEYHHRILELARARSERENKHRIILLYLRPDIHLEYHRKKYPDSQLTKLPDEKAKETLRRRFENVKEKVERAVRDGKKIADFSFEIRDASSPRYPFKA